MWFINARKDEGARPSQMKDDGDPTRRELGPEGLDPFTEYQIQQALELILAETTSILIAHRLSTVRASDLIVVLRHGRIIEQGNHAGLIERGGHYAELYNTYFRHQSLDYVQQARKAALSTQ